MSNSSSKSQKSQRRVLQNHLYNEARLRLLRAWSINVHKITHIMFFKIFALSLETVWFKFGNRLAYDWKRRGLRLGTAWFKIESSFAAVTRGLAKS